MIRIAIVNYLNNAPFFYGMEQHGILSDARFKVNAYHPADCAKALLTGNADLGLIPVAVLSKLDNYHILGDTCIGAVEPVRSVLLVGDVPVEEMKQVLLDYQSRTSVALCRILLRDYWRTSPEIIPGETNYLEKIAGETGGVVIGDRAFEASRKYKYVYDLAEAWQAMTGKPFVFAVWVSLSPIDPELAETLNRAFKAGIESSEAAAMKVMGEYPEYFDVKNYLTRSISYTLDEPKRLGMETFLSLLSMPDGR